MRNNLTRVGANIRFDPKSATKEILRAYRASKGDATNAALRLGVTRRTLDRWVQLLNLEGEVAALRQKHRKPKQRQRSGRE